MGEIWANGRPTTSFSAALLAGGQSKRMGENKALIRDPASGQFLWRRQLSVLQKLKPDKIYWSEFARPEIFAEVEIVKDTVSNAGPLGGIHACLNNPRSDLLVVLAIDLPQMTSSFIRKMVESCTRDCGVVMKHGLYYEPLAAVYPKVLAGLAHTHLDQKRFALQELLMEAETEGLMRSILLREEELPLFKNVNLPSDI